MKAVQIKSSAKAKMPKQNKYRKLVRACFGPLSVQMFLQISNQSAFQSLSAITNIPGSGTIEPSWLYRGKEAPGARKRWVRRVWAERGMA